MANGVASFQVPTLNNNNYDNCSIKMKALLGAHDVWDVIEKGYNEPQNEASLSQSEKDSLKDSRKKDNKALFLIYQALDDNSFEKILDTTSAKKHRRSSKHHIKDKKSEEGASSNFKKGV